MLLESGMTLEKNNRKKKCKVDANEQCVASGCLVKTFFFNLNNPILRYHCANLLN